MSAIFGETLTFTQDIIPEIKLVVFGDEFYARYENEDGYSVVYDSDISSFCYAVLINGEFVSSGKLLMEDPPPGLRRHLKESDTVRNTKFEQRYASMIPPIEVGPPHETMRTFGANKGLLRGRRASMGKVRGLTILVQFQDLESAVTADEVSEMLNGENYTANGNFCSVNEYFRLISDNNLDYSNVVVGPITLSQDRNYYIDHLLVKEALDAVADLGIDLSQFDSKNEGVIDAINFMYAGQTQYLGELWPHNFHINLQYGDFKTHFYMLSSLGRNSADLSIGTFCHENGHMLCRFPDMYDYGKRDGDFEKSAGIGRYCLMGSGNHLNRGRTPSPVSAYLRDLVGWCDKKVTLNTPGEYEALHADYGTVTMFETDKENEYFILENRSRIGLDQHLPSSGLAIYHCDFLGSNEWQGGTPSRHYQCGLLQADGHLDLEHNLNQGDDTDLFGKIDGIALSHSTTPSSRTWDGVESGLTLSKVSDPSTTIHFTIDDSTA
jgi:M6 family metalloprotease-like protein